MSSIVDRIEGLQIKTIEFADQNSSFHISLPFPPPAISRAQPFGSDVHLSGLMTSDIQPTDIRSHVAAETSAHRSSVSDKPGMQVSFNVSVGQFGGGQFGVEKTTQNP